MTMITPSYLGETIEYSSLHACRSTLEDPTGPAHLRRPLEAVRPKRSGRTSVRDIILVRRPPAREIEHAAGGEAAIFR